MTYQHTFTKSTVQIKYDKGKNIRNHCKIYISNWVYFFCLCSYMHEPKRLQHGKERENPTTCQQKYQAA